VLLSALARTTPLERTGISSSITKGEKRLLRRVELEVEVHVRLELGLLVVSRNRLGLVHSGCGFHRESRMISPLAHRKDRPFKSFYNCNWTVGTQCSW